MGRSALGRGAGIAFVHRGKILLLQRSKAVLRPGQWNLPGGTAERGETYEQTALREAREEAGPIPPHRTTRTCAAGHYVIFVAEVARPFRPSLNWESTRHRWVPLRTATALPLVEELHAAIEGGCFATKGSPWPT